MYKLIFHFLDQISILIIYLYSGFMSSYFWKMYFGYPVVCFHVGFPHILTIHRCYMRILDFELCWVTVSQMSFSHFIIKLWLHLSCIWSTISYLAVRFVSLLLFFKKKKHKVGISEATWPCWDAFVKMNFQINQ